MIKRGYINSYRDALGSKKVDGLICPGTGFLLEGTAEFKKQQF